MALLMFRKKQKRYEYYFCQIPNLYLLDDPATSNRRSLELSFFNLGSQGYQLVGRWEDHYIFMKEV